MTKIKRSITGIQSTGALHVGNLLGAIKPALARQSDYSCYYFIADLHALTTTRDPAMIQSQVFDTAATWIAFGLDTSSHALYRQSDVPMVAEYAWYLSCVTGLGLLEKAHAYKDAVAKGKKDATHGLFAYPVLMAADILMYDADIVPVGKDQKQHVEMARDMAGSFNAFYGENIIKVPEVVIEEKVMVIPGLDGQKMSKSYGNTIPLFCDEKTLKQRVFSVKTDSTPLEAPKELKGTVLGDLYELFSTPGEYSDLEKRLKNGGMGWGHAKEELFNVINAALRVPREKYNELRADEQNIDKVLRNGAEKAFETAKPILNRVRRAVGMRDYPYKISWQ